MSVKQLLLFTNSGSTPDTFRNYLGSLNTFSTLLLTIEFTMLVTTSNTFQIITFTNFRYLDKNYAGTLIIWDRMFGSFEPEQEEVVYGVQNSNKFTISHIRSLTILEHGILSSSNFTTYTKLTSLPILYQVNPKFRISHCQASTTNSEFFSILALLSMAKSFTPTNRQTLLLSPPKISRNTMETCLTSL